jgi:hypothetical protein
MLLGGAIDPAATLRRKPMTLICPKCLEEAVIRLDLADGDTLTRGACDEEYSADTVRQLVDGWAKLLPWIEQHPAQVEEPATR